MWRKCRHLRAVFYYFCFGILGLYLLSVSKSANDRGHSLAHPLENKCKYPILDPEDPNLHPFIVHGKRIDCSPNQEVDLVTLDDNFVLIVDQGLAKSIYDQYVDCYYRPIDGGVLPNTRSIAVTRDWKKIDSDHRSNRVRSPATYDDMIEVRCYLQNQTDVGKLLKSAPRSNREPIEVFRYAFAQIGRPVKAAPVEDPTGRRNPPHKYGVDILVLDSTSLNMFRRHARSSWRYMKKEMGFFHLDGYTKVADNSLVNLIPLLTGLRYLDSGDGKPSDFPLNETLDSDQVPLLWRLFKAADCATMFNDDIAVSTRGFWNYPKQSTPGFTTKPTDHFYRPWNLYHRSYPIFNSSTFCFGSRPYYQDFIRLTEQMIRRYRDQCHFSFNFLTDLTHDDSNNLEPMDDYLKHTLARLHRRGDLNNTILIIMGDHGNRVNLIRYRYVGRIEERMPLFTVYLPPSFQQRYPEQVENLRRNQHRLTSHYDTYQMIHDVLVGAFGSNRGKTLRDKWSEKRKGTSLFKPISPDRTCHDANIPENHCVCMIPTTNETSSHVQVRSRVANVITRWTNDRCHKSGSYSVHILSMETLTTNQYVQQGVRHLIEDNVTVSQVRQKKWVGDIEYLDVTYEVTKNRSTAAPVKAAIRLQHNRKLKRVSVSVEPRLLSGSVTCDDVQYRNCVCLYDCLLYCL